jgi:hypothetical protein
VIEWIVLALVTLTVVATLGGLPRRGIARPRTMFAVAAKITEVEHRQSRMPEMRGRVLVISRVRSVLRVHDARDTGVPRRPAPRGKRMRAALLRRPRVLLRGKRSRVRPNFRARGKPVGRPRDRRT